MAGSALRRSSPAPPPGTGLGNYDISYVTAALTVEPRPLTITADDQTKTYGDRSSSTRPPRPTTSASSAWSTATPSTSVTLTSAGAAAGATVAGSPYADRRGAAPGTGLGNYDISYVDGTLTVDARPTDDHGRQPDQDLRRPSCSTRPARPTTSARRPGQRRHRHQRHPDQRRRSRRRAVAPTYAIVASGALGTGLGNYEISYVDGTLTVEQDELDDHGRRPDQDLRRPSCSTRPARPTTSARRPGQRRHRHQRDPDQRRRSRRATVALARTRSSPAARSAPASATTRSATSTAP